MLETIAPEAKNGQTSKSQTRCAADLASAQWRGPIPRQVPKSSLLGWLLFGVRLGFSMVRMMGLVAAGVFALAPLLPIIALMHLARLLHGSENSENVV